MDFFDWLTMAGGAALFLYGMFLMEEELEQMSGARLGKLLERLTGNPFKAVLAGCGVTALLQSSSAVTVMLVGLVDVGMMGLRQTVGVIMGANIGTTATSWLLSLTGIRGDSFFLRLFSPSSLAPVMALAGVAALNFSKKSRLKNAAGALIGISILMFGMNTMCTAAKPLAQMPEFAEIMVRFQNPLLGVAAGTALTALIQSSSASVGILQALCASGAVSYRAALPVIMGQNIGTCVTTFLACTGADVNAKRAALIHFYFNLIGTGLFMAGYCLADFFFALPFMERAADPKGIAFVHSMFNILSTVCLLPFSGFLVRLSCMTVRTGKKSPRPPLPGRKAPEGSSIL